MSGDVPDFVIVPTETRARAADVIHNALFVEDEQDGPVFRWVEDIRLLHDDHLWLCCAADAVINDLVAHPEVLEELLQVARAQKEWRAS